MRTRRRLRQLKMPDDGWPARLYRAILSTDRSAVAGFLTVALITSALFPARGAEKLPSLCPFYHLTGRRCPGCGMSRAFILISHGQVRRAYRMNNISILAYAAGLYVALTGLRDMYTFLRSQQSRSTA